MPDWTTWAILLGSAFVPPFLWLLVIRNTERYGREPMGRVFRAFFWGAVVAVIVAIVISLLVVAVVLPKAEPLYEFLGQRGLSDPALLLSVLIVAPFVEEFAKALGVLRVRRFLKEPEDGLVYGASAGLGFAATENLFYGLSALVASQSLTTSILVIGVRSVSSALLHASATASTGYGIGKGRLWGSSAIPWYLLAVLMHATFNLFASFGVLLTATLGDWAGLLGLLAAIVFAGIAFVLVRQKIREKD